MDHKYTRSSQSYSSTPVAPLVKKVQVVYYLSYKGGLLEQPHLLEVSLSSSSRGLSLRDVKTRLTSLRGTVMSSSFSWSYKRSYKEGFVWQDLESDDDLIFPTNGFVGSEYVLKGCRIESSCSVGQMPASTTKMPHNLRKIVQGISTPMQPGSRLLAELPALPTETQSDKAMNLVAINEHANKIMITSPSNASLHGSDDITFNLGMIEGLEHLHLAKAIDPHYEYAESQASTSLNHTYNTMEQKKKIVQNHRLSKEPSVSTMKGSIIEVQQYGSLQFSVIKKVEGECGTSSNPCLFVGTDVATQTGEDDETTDKHRKGKTSCPPDFNHADKLLCPKSREGSFLKQRGSLQSAFIELSREEISPPPCSTSSSSTTMSAHSASSSNGIGCSVNPLRKLSLNQSGCLAEDQNLQKMELILLPRVLSDKEARLVEEEEALATKSTLDSECQSWKTPSQSAGFIENPSSDVVDHSCKNPKSVLSSSKVKPHVMSIFSTSGRFLQLVSCGKGLEVIKPSDMRIQRSSSMSGIHADDSEEASAQQHSSLLNARAEVTSCLDLSSPNVNLESDTQTIIADSCLPTTAAHDVPDDNSFSNADGNLLAPLPQNGYSSMKKLWHLSGWVHSHYKKRKSTTKSKSVSSNSAAAEDTYAYLDLFEKHVTNSSADGLNAKDSSTQCRLIRVGSADYSSSSHQRGLSYGRNSSVNRMDEWVASPLQRPEFSRGLTMSSFTSSKCGFDGGESNNFAWRNSLPVYGLDTLNAKDGSPTLLKPKNSSRQRYAI